MKHILTGLLCLLMLASCSSDEKQFTLKGHFRHLQSGDFYVFSTDPMWKGFDTVHVDEGSFRYSRPLTDTTVLTIQYPNFMQMQVIVAPGATTTISGDANNLLKTKIGGLDDNELLSDFRQSLIKKEQSDDKLAEAFIRSHPASFASIAVLQRYFLNAENIDFDKTEALLKLILQASPQRTMTKTLYAQFTELSRCAPGKRLPKFSATTDSGLKVDNTTFRGKHLVIWFWAMWNTEMSYPVMHVRDLIKSCDGHLQALNICLDADTVALHRVMKRDTIGGHVVCDRLEWQSPLVKTFGVRDVPSAILVDTAGTVIARDLNEESLTEKLESLGIKKTN